MDIKGRFNILTERLGIKLEEGIERVINSHLLKEMENRVIGDDFMPRKKKTPIPTIPKDEHNDRMCNCPTPINGSVVDGIVYCAICQGILGCVESIK